MLARESGYRYGVDSSTVSLSDSGALTVTATLRNHGSAPAYEAWQVKVELVNSGGAIVWQAPLNASLGALAGGGVTATTQGSWSLPLLASGDYTLRLVARDSSSSPRAPLKWVVSERASDGGLAIASLRKR